MAYNMYAKVDTAEEAKKKEQSVSMYAPNAGEWLRDAGVNNTSDNSWMHMERTKERLLENVVKATDRASVNSFKRAQQTVLEGEGLSKDLSTILTAKRPAEKKPDTTKKLLGSLVKVKGRERPSDATSPGGGAKKPKVEDGSGVGDEGRQEVIGAGAGALPNALAAFADYSDSDEDAS